MVDLDLLPNPRLADFLPDNFEPSPDLIAFSTEHPLGHAGHYRRHRSAEQCLVAPYRAAHLEACGLPRHYDELNDDGQKMARRSSFESWFNPKKPQQLVCDIESFLRSAYLWVEEMIKPSERNAGKYYNRDPYHKYSMLREAFTPSNTPTEPSKVLLTAPRGSTKTVTVIGQAVPMIAVVRPYSSILVSEINRARTAEELNYIRSEIEENEIIAQEFGGKGVLFPSKLATAKWRDSQLDFIHLRGNTIRAFSIKMAQRGRHPLLWVIDDPEDPKNRMTKEAKREFFIALFRKGLPMLSGGGALIWMSTLILGGAAHTAMRTKAITEDSEMAEDPSMSECRFDDWRKANFDLLLEQDGKMISIYPDHLSTVGYEQKERSMGKRDAMAEYRGIATAAGMFVFSRSDTLHGYMHCKGQPDRFLGEDYFLDCKSGKTMPWKDFLAALITVTAMDPADSMSPDSDNGAVIVGGRDENYITYVLDAIVRRGIVDTQLEEAFSLCGIWRCDRLGVETAAMQTIVMRMAHRLREKLEKSDMPVPQLIEISQGTKNKTARIIAGLRPLFNLDKVRFPAYEPRTTVDGVTHLPFETRSRPSVSVLLSEIDTFTDEGASETDDAIDCLEMVIRILGQLAGVPPVEEDETARILEKWKEVGADVNHHTLPMESWTPEMWSKARNPGILDPVDPYLELEVYE